MKRSLAFALFAITLGWVLTACGGGGDAASSGAPSAGSANTDKLTIVGAGS